MMGRIGGVGAFLIALNFPGPIRRIVVRFLGYGLQTFFGQRIQTAA